MSSQQITETQICHCCKQIGNRMHWKQFPNYIAASCVDTRKCQIAAKLTAEKVVELYGEMPDENKAEVFVLYHTGVVYQSPPSETKNRTKKFLYGPRGAV